jgi:glycine cleavage system aminomethyltransferase T
MKIPQYITVEEVKRVCSELGIRDWSSISEARVPLEEAEKILPRVNLNAMPIMPAVFRQGLEVELEHGTRFQDANVTNNHPILTGMIVLAHLKESMEYYERLEVAEIEGDLLKAILAGDMDKIRHKYRLLLDAKSALVEAEGRQL